jgi:hypothetical protein
VAPSDSQLANLVYLVASADKAPTRITHGKAHRALAAVVRSLLRILPGLIAEAEAEFAAANREGRITDMGHFASRLRALRAATEPFRPITARRDLRGAWHGWATPMEHEVQAIVGQCGGKPVSFAHEAAPGVQILASLLGKPDSQVFEALRKKTPGK